PCPHSLFFPCPAAHRDLHSFPTRRSSDLAEAGAVRTPEVLEIGADYLALQWVAPGRLDAAGIEELGRGLARTHAAAPERFGGVAPAAGESAARFGSLQLPNDPAPDWPTFYGEQRLLALA